MTAHTQITDSDSAQGRISAIMADGRERTVGDVATKIGMTPAATLAHMRVMLDAGKLKRDVQSIDGKRFGFWSAPKSVVTGLDKMRADAMEANVRLGLSAIPNYRPGPQPKTTVERNALDTRTANLIAAMRGRGWLTTSEIAYMTGREAESIRKATLALRKRGLLEYRIGVRAGNKGGIPFEYRVAEA